MVYYGLGVFYGAPNPFLETAECKFNPLQQLVYLFVMYAALPGMIVTGFVYLFPEWTPDLILGFPGLPVIAMFHYLLGLLLTVFLLGHVYLALAEMPPSSESKK